MDQLRNITKNDIRRSKTSPPTNISVYAKVVEVYDGDTCDLVFIRNGDFERFKCRLAEIDTPEMEDGNTAALKARDFLVWLSLCKTPSKFNGSSQPWSKNQIQQFLDENEELVYAEFQGVGYFGRPLVTLRKAPGAKKSFNGIMIQYGYAEVYS